MKNTSHLLEWLLSRRLEIRSIGEDVEKKESLYTVDRNVNGAAIMEHSMEVPPQDYHMIQKFHFWVFAGENKNINLKSIALSCLWQYYLQQPRHGSNLNVHPQRNGQRRCGTYNIQWNSTQIQREQNNAICRNRGTPRHRYTKWSKLARKWQMQYVITHVQNLKKDTNYLIYK